ncbi:hypothetical protein FO519_009232 [Halicephalobus sp. NKZ332]|nr:hypothetical protein FO519_009232 [Halicephalobus sp. NKZ332]
MEKHEKYAPPDDQIQFSLDIDLVQILMVNEQKQRVTVQVFVYEEWLDKSLKWDPGDFNGIKQTWIPPDKIWISDITVLNALEFMNIMEAVRTPVEVLHTGKIVRSYPAIYTAACDIAIANFPLDQQKCFLDIASWGYSREKLVIRFGNRSSLAHYRHNVEWALRGVLINELVYEFEGLIHSEARFIIEIARKPLHYIISLVLPCYIICLLGIAGLFARFSTKPERQERFSLGVTAIVSVAVYGTVVAEKIPHTSREIPLLLGFFLHNLVILSLASMLTGIILMLNYKRQGTSKMPPKWILKILRYDLNETKKERKREVSESWDTISDRLDRLLFVIFFFAITIPTIGISTKCLEQLTVEDKLILERTTN